MSPLDDKTPEDGVIQLVFEGVNVGSGEMEGVVVKTKKYIPYDIFLEIANNELSERKVDGYTNGVKDHLLDLSPLEVESFSKLVKLFTSDYRNRLKNIDKAYNFWLALDKERFLKDGEKLLTEKTEKALIALVGLLDREDGGTEDIARLRLLLKGGSVINFLSDLKEETSRAYNQFIMELEKFPSSIVDLLLAEGKEIEVVPKCPDAEEIADNVVRVLSSAGLLNKGKFSDLETDVQQDIIYTLNDLYPKLG